jgi:hypothetical protein
MLGIICSNSLRSLLKKINASKIINAAIISLQYNLAENDLIFLYKGGKFRRFCAKICKQKFGIVRPLSIVFYISQTKIIDESLIL